MLEVEVEVDARVIQPRRARRPTEEERAWPEPPNACPLPALLGRCDLGDGGRPVRSPAPAGRGKNRAWGVGRGVWGAGRGRGLDMHLDMPHDRELRKGSVCAIRPNAALERLPLDLSKLTLPYVLASRLAEATVEQLASTRHDPRALRARTLKRNFCCPADEQREVVPVRGTHESRLERAQLRAARTHGPLELFGGEPLAPCGLYATRGADARREERDDVLRARRRKMA